MIKDPREPNVKSEIKSTLSGQRLQPSGRIHIPKKGWIPRIITISILVGLISYNLYQGIKILDPFILHASIVLIDALIVVTVGWSFYKNPAKGIAGNALVSVLIPVYNQKNMISIVIDAIANSTYKNIEIIAVNDGSTDGSKEILDDLAKKYPSLRVFHKKNEGKRKANFLGFSKSTGEFVIFIDSDSVVDQHAVIEMMKTFSVNPGVGALVGHIKAWNSKTHLLPKLQDAWYDFEFNILKTTQSTLGHVMVCSGCFAAYRREAIEKFVPLWNGTNNLEKNLDPKKYFKTNPWRYRIFSKIPIKILEWASQFDDAEDSVLTAQVLIDWKTKYVSTSIVYTDVPETLKGFTKQQLRWRKGYLRAMFFVVTFLWQKNPLLSFMFYVNVIALVTMPIILFTMFYYGPLVLHQYGFVVAFFLGVIGIGFAHGIDYKFRDPTSKNWKFRPLMNILMAFLFSFLTIPALLTFRKSSWLTR